MMVYNKLLPNDKCWVLVVPRADDVPSYVSSGRYGGALLGTADNYCWIKTKPGSWTSKLLVDRRFVGMTEEDLIGRLLKFTLPQLTL